MRRTKSPWRRSPQALVLGYNRRLNRRSGALDRNMQEFSWPVRVYYEDTDAGGVVYHAGYLRFMERCRTEWLRALGYEQDRLAQEEGILFVVRRMSIDFIAPARFNDRLDVTGVASRVRRASLEFDQRVLRAEDGKPLCAAQVHIACIGASSFVPCAMPDPLAKVIRVGA